MAPAITCYVTDCGYPTPANLFSNAALQVYLPLAPAQPAAPSTSRVERPARPSVTEGITESEWNLFLHKWGRYTWQTRISDVMLRDELGSCMETDLRQVAFNQGFVITKEELKIKDLSIMILHPSSHVVALH